MRMSDIVKQKNTSKTHFIKKRREYALMSLCIISFPSMKFLPIQIGKNYIEQRSETSKKVTHN